MDIVLPDELLLIKNPDVRALYQASYTVYNLKIANEDFASFKALLDPRSDYLVILTTHRGQKEKKLKIIAKHNVSLDDVVNLRSVYDITYRNSVWDIEPLGTMIERCQDCYQYRYLNASSTPCNSCKSMRKILLDQPCILLPISSKIREDEDGEADRLRIYLNNELQHDVDIQLALPTESDVWWAIIDFGEENIGKEITLAELVAKHASEVCHLGLNLIKTGTVDLSQEYQEKLRPQLRFSQLRGWNNDPNGLVYHNGEYHLFWQSNPFGNRWGNMYWGHAVSTDLLHWQTLPPALKSRSDSGGKGLCFSGSAYSIPGELVIVFTDTGKGECMVSSYDDGRTWSLQNGGNPIIEHKGMGRDPKLIWHEESKRWVIIVYSIITTENSEISGFSFYVSEDRKSWKRTGFIEGFYECPELIRLSIPSVPGKEKWILFGADSEYMIGEFDGLSFEPDPEYRSAEGYVQKSKLHYGKFKASQCFNNIKDRVIQIGWATIDTNLEMPFNQAFSLPLELTLIRDSDSRLRLHAWPIKELESLAALEYERENFDLESQQSLNIPLIGQLFDIQMVFSSLGSQALNIRFGKNTLSYDLTERILRSDNPEITIPLNLGVSPPKEPTPTGKMQAPRRNLNAVEPVILRLVIDRPMYELASYGIYYTESRIDPGEDLRRFELEVVGEGVVHFESVRISRLMSIWSPNKVV